METCSKQLVQSLGMENPLEKEVTENPLSILAWELPWTEGYSGLRPWRCKQSGKDWRLACTVAERERPILSRSSFSLGVQWIPALQSGWSQLWPAASARRNLGWKWGGSACGGAVYIWKGPKWCDIDFFLASPPSARERKCWPCRNITLFFSKTYDSS